VDEAEEEYDDEEFLNSITADESNKICYLNNKLLPHIEICPNKSFINAEIELAASFALDYQMNNDKFNSFDQLVSVLEEKENIVLNDSE
jgi:hypothetical protein